MATNWETIDLPISGGLDTKSDEKLAPATKLAELENAVFNKRGGVTKRSGYSVLDSVDAADAEVTFTGVASRDNELLGFSTDKLYSYVSSQATSGIWSEVANIPFCTTEVRRDVYTSGNLQAMSYDESDTVGVYAWFNSSSGNTEYKAVDKTTRNVLHQGTLSTASDYYAGPAVVKLPKTVAIVWAENVSGNWTLKTAHIVSDNPSAIQATSTISTTAYFSAIDPIFRVRAWKEFICVLFCPVGAEDLQLVVCDVAGGQTKPSLYGARGQYTFNSDSGAMNAAYADEADFDITDEGHIVVAKRDATALYVAKGSLNEFSAGSPVVLELEYLDDITISGTPLDNTLGCSLSIDLDSAGDRVYSTVFTDLASGYYRTNSFVIRGGSSYTATLQNSGVASNMVRYSTGGLVAVVTPYSHQKTCQLVHVNASGEFVLVASLFPGAAKPDLNFCNLREHGSKVTFAGVEAISLTNNGVDSSGAALLTLSNYQPRVCEFTFGNQPSTAVHGQTLYIASGNLLQYDGQSCYEVGFNSYPEPTKMVATTSAGSITFSNDDTVSYRVYYERQNAQGLVERGFGLPVTFTAKSSPSGNFQFQSGASKKITLTLPTYTLTHDENVRFAIYRTEINPTSGALYYRVSSQTISTSGSDNGWKWNDTTAPTTTFVDNMTDATLILQEPDLGAAAGALADIPPQAPNFVTAGRNRLVVGGGGVGRYSVQFSKLPIPGYAPSFSDALVIEVDRATGPVTAVATSGDSAVVFKSKAVWSVDGEGTDNLGIGDWATPRLLSLDTGCSVAASVVQCPIGLLFKGSKGIYAVGQQGLNYVGADVEAFNGLATTSAHIVPNKNHIIFLHSDGVALVYDYFFNQWSTFTNHSGGGACVTDSNYYYLRGNGTVYKSAEGTWLDDGVPYELRMTTNWLRLDKLQDFFRLRRFSILGEYHHAHKLYVRIYNDYESFPTDSISFTPKADDSSSLMEYVAWGDGNWGDGAWGMTEELPLGGVYQFQDRVSRQKTQAVKIEIYDSNMETLASDTAANTGRGYEIQAISLEVGRKGGLFRVHEGRKV